MGLNFDYSLGQTPLDEEESEGLKIPTISTKGELDEFEQKKHRGSSSMDSRFKD